MTIPAAATNIHLDAGTDDPKQARVELSDLVTKFNTLRTHVSGTMEKAQNLNDVADAPTAKANLGVIDAHDIPFKAGFDGEGLAEDLAVKNYGEILISRSVEMTGIVANLSTAATGAALIFDILKNGSTIYDTKPQFAASSTTLTDGDFIASASEIAFAAGDRLVFTVTQIGSTTPGDKLLVSVLAAIA